MHVCKRERERERRDRSGGKERVLLERTRVQASFGERGAKQGGKKEKLGGEVGNRARRKSKTQEPG